MISGPNKDKALAKVFKTHRTVKFSECDPAQIMFFGTIFTWAHDSFENWILEAGFQWEDWFKSADFIVPIRHSTADHSKIFVPGETYEIHALVKALGTTSMTLKYIFKSPAGIHATVEMVHVFLDAKTKKPVPVPVPVRQKFLPYQETP